MEMDPNLLVDAKTQAEFEQTYRHELLPDTEDATTDYFYGDPKVDVESIILARYPRMRSSPARLRSMVEKTIKSWEKENRRNSSNPSLDEDESMSDVFQGSCIYSIIIHVIGTEQAPVTSSTHSLLPNKEYSSQIEDLTDRPPHNNPSITGIAQSSWGIESPDHFNNEFNVGEPSLGSDYATTPYLFDNRAGSPDNDGNRNYTLAFSFPSTNSQSITKK